MAGKPRELSAEEIDDQFSKLNTLPMAFAVGLDDDGRMMYLSKGAGLPAMLPIMQGMYQWTHVKMEEFNTYFDALHGTTKYVREFLREIAPLVEDSGDEKLKGKWTEALSQVTKLGIMSDDG